MRKLPPDYGYNWNGGRSPSTRGHKAKVEGHVLDQPGMSEDKNVEKKGKALTGDRSGDTLAVFIDMTRLANQQNSNPQQ